jgi:hypothetical protein
MVGEAEVVVVDVVGVKAAEEGEEGRDAGGPGLDEVARLGTPVGRMLHGRAFRWGLVGI